MQNQPQRNDQLPFFAKIEAMRNMMAFPALTVMVCLRRNLGYRAINPVHLMVMTAVLFFLASFAKDTPNAEALSVFAVFMFVAGLAQRAKRWRDYRRGVRSHSYYIGDSILEFRWLPRFIRSNRKVARLLDPLVCLVGGICLVNTSPALGLWLAFSGMALRIFEDTVYRREMKRELDTIDGMIASGIQAGTAEVFSESPQRRAYQEEHDAGIPTGIGKDIKRKIERLRSDRHAPGSENLTSASQSPSAPRTMSQRFWRFFWGRHLYDWWSRRHQKSKASNARPGVIKLK